MTKDLDLAGFLKLTNADGALIINANGELLDSQNINFENNFAAMMGVMLKMANDFSEDIKIGNLHQFVFKAEEGVFIVDKFDDDFIVGIYSKDKSKAGLIMMSMDNLSKKQKV